MRKMDTKLSIEQIHVALRNSVLWNKRTDIMIPNLSWAMLPYEADFVVINRSGYMTEIEIKRSWEDFKADFKKGHKHDDERVYKFAYCVPQCIAEKVVSFLRDKYQGIPDWEIPGVLYYTEDMEIGFTKLRNMENFTAKRRRRLFLEEQLTVARLGQLRYWNFVENSFSKTIENDDED